MADKPAPLIPNPFDMFDRVLRGTVPAYQGARQEMDDRGITAASAAQGLLGTFGPQADIIDAQRNYQSASNKARSGDYVGAAGDAGWGLLSHMGLSELSAPLSAMAVGAGRKNWFHGTTNADEIATEGFKPRTHSSLRISDPDLREANQAKLNEMRAQGLTPRDSAEMSALMQSNAHLQRPVDFPTPVFTTSRKDVARSYTDPSNMLRPQDAKPGVFQVDAPRGKSFADIDLGGDDFRGIPIDKAVSALARNDADRIKIERIFRQAAPHVDTESRKMSTDVFAEIAYELGYDSIDVKNVRDSYMGKGPKSTVRIVLNPETLTVLKKLGVAGLVAFGGASVLSMQGEES